MKSYTDIEQSKKLAEILPLESADTIWNLTNPDLPNIRAIPYEYSDYNNKNLDIIPAWSLAALLHVLPYPTLYQQGDGAWGLDVWVEQVKPYSVKNAICEVDACVEMIIKLHEQKLL